MKKILHVISSPKGDNSYSIKLSNAIVEKIKETYPGSIVHVRDVAKNPFPHVEEATLTAFFTPATQQSAENKVALKNSDEAIAEVMEADIIVIGVPFYNFSIPSSLKAWVDHVARANVTFKYDATGVEGLVKGKVVYVAIASGGIYSAGPMQQYDFAAPYLKSLLGFLGMTDLKIFRVEGVAMPGQAELALQQGIASIAL